MTKSYKDLRVESTRKDFNKIQSDAIKSVAAAQDNVGKLIKDPTQFFNKDLKKMFKELIAIGERLSKIKQ